jgi:hypothetical protein
MHDQRRSDGAGGLFFPGVTCRSMNRLVSWERLSSASNARLITSPAMEKWPAVHTPENKEITHRILGPQVCRPLFLMPSEVLYAQGAIMIDPSSRLDRELKAADEFFALSRTATSPFMRAYYQRVGERYLSSQGELRVPSERQDNAGLRKLTDR